MRLRRKPHQDDAIDMGPLIDMVFILLIFFAVSSTFVKDMKLDLQRPSAASANLASTKAIRVFIAPSSAVYIDEQPVKVWMLQSRVRDRIRATTSKKVLVVTDGRVPAEKVIEVVDQCRLGGAEDVGVATEAKAP